MAELPNLVDITDGDPDWTWDVCVSCGPKEITQRGLFVSASPLGRWGARRVAWCADAGCQADRNISGGLGQVVAVNADGSTQKAWETS